MNGAIPMNGVSDSLFDCCLQNDNKIVQAISLAFDRMFQFDCVLTVDYLILIIFPILFKIYGFGVQQRLRNFYDTARLIFIEFIFLCSFSVSLTTIIHLFIKQPMACVTWDGRTIAPAFNGSRSPNHEIIIIMILGLGVWFLKVGYDKVRKLITIVVIAVECVSTVFAGCASISQALISVAFGFWVVFLFKFIPPIGIPILGVFTIIISITLFIFTYKHYIWNALMLRQSMHLCVRGFISLVISICLELRFGFGREDFDWMKISWGSHWSNQSTEDDDEVVIPSMIKENIRDDFGKLLKNDLIDSVIAFIVFLLGNMGLCFADSTFAFMIE
ncbi:hypothetical protein TVAG_168920 [Trichomonas vaginalis G3]|uniref:Uncharacterized protein n=1 Tax=Trichomonas vaginalis (strain ATCC PRA-98 / G3) TaxID=412133 RepID=A2EWR0_TRIV3|nr:hypothetical protein TVAGG3_0211440 [Trichomonas vaginalis G3]EAY02890.1 hypothetical protein TVAG_168920 [Trichomonas vaginalis G3]KAI5551255.1 hypothetical protein TVAGG3_0211440 [Trichomonas vaginalis G3]|eukprot:XP_001315113.1 hypothetical protein [Trichomonas vaginalis G3]